MRLFVGLGNPGPKFARNRHNVGFMAVDEIARRHGFAPWRRRFQGETSEGTLGTERVILLKPMTYMNESGRSVQEAASFFKIAPGDVTVFHDELELPPGKVRVRSAVVSPATTACARSPPISATSTAGCGSVSVIPASRN
jgi:PTH1 family peptidyl-tRNA hydrolase